MSRAVFITTALAAGFVWVIVRVAKTLPEPLTIFYRGTNGNLITTTGP